MRLTPKTLCLLVAGLFLASACGQKGPLFLPGDPSTIKTDIPAKPDKQDDEKKKDDENQQ